MNTTLLEVFERALQERNAGHAGRDWLVSFGDARAALEAALAQQAQPLTDDECAVIDAEGVKRCVTCLSAMTQPEPKDSSCPYCGSLVERSLLADGFRELNMERHGFRVTAISAQPAPLMDEMIERGKRAVLAQLPESVVLSHYEAECIARAVVGTRSSPNFALRCPNES